MLTCICRISQGRSIVRTGSYSQCEQSRKVIKVPQTQKCVRQSSKSGNFS